MGSLGELRIRLEAAEAGDNGDPVARQRHVDAALALIVALINELEEAEADVVLAMLMPLVRHNPQLEIETRRRLAAELVRISELGRAIAQLRVAHALADGLGLAGVAADIAGALDDARQEQAKHAGARIESSTSALVDAAQQVDDPELASAMERSLARLASGDDRERHARRSLAHALDAVDPQLVADATSYLCEVLVERDALAEAKLLLEQRPPTRDGRADRALYDEIRRRLGEPVTDPPDEPDERAQLDPAVLAYANKPHNLAQSITDGALPDPLKIREWAAGTVHAPADLESQKIFGPVRSFWCACGRFRGREYAGMCCPRCGVEIVHASQRRTRIGCILLAEPVIHPWYAAAAGMVLDEPATTVLATPIPELRARLASVALDALAAQLKHAVVTAPKPRVADQAGRRLAVIEAFRRAAATFGTRPESVILEVVIVVPPHGELGCDREAVRAAYAGILDAPAADQRQAVVALFDAFASGRT